MFLLFCPNPLKSAPQPCLCEQSPPGFNERWHPLPLQFRNGNSQPTSYVWWCQSNICFDFHLWKKITSKIILIQKLFMFFVCFLSVCVCWGQSLENESIHWVYCRWAQYGRPQIRVSKYLCWNWPLCYVQNRPCTLCQRM